MFYYQKGDISTTIPWDQPSPLAFNQWLEEWSQTSGVKEYEVFLVGAFCQTYFLNKDISTWDIDITLMGKIQDYSMLKNILDKAVGIGFKHKLLIDIFWRDHLPKVNLLSQKKVITYTSILKQSPNDSWKEPVYGEITELIPGLYEVNHSSEKAYNKFKTKNYTLNYKKIEF
jgi:hypothetical protein